MLRPSAPPSNHCPFHYLPLKAGRAERRRPRLPPVGNHV